MRHLRKIFITWRDAIFLSQEILRIKREIPDKIRTDEGGESLALFHWIKQHNQKISFSAQLMIIKILIREQPHRASLITRLIVLSGGSNHGLFSELINS